MLLLCTSLKASNKRRESNRIRIEKLRLKFVIKILSFIREENPVE